MNSEQPWRPTKEQLAQAVDRKIPDVIRKQLSLLFVGINPSLYSAATGHHFARPGNRFWPALHNSGITERLLSPFEDQKLSAYGCGITNMVARATRRAAELSAAELVSGSRLLERKVSRYQIGRVVFLGVTTYRQAFDRRSATVGLQEETMQGVPIWVLPNPSGLNAHYQAADFAELFAQVHHAD